MVNDMIKLRPQTQQETNDAVKQIIVMTETAQTPRRVREAILEIANKVGADCSFLRGLDNTLKTERSKLK